jgi:hypothetical protein
VWLDDFDGPAGAPPSSAHWTPEQGGGGWGDDQLQTYTERNAALDGQGRLEIVARREEDGTITSARLHTKGKVHARHARVEASIRVPAGRGMWPAFWMLGSDIDEVGWPACGEIDVMEHVGSEPCVVHGTTHVPNAAGVGLGIGSSFAAREPLADGFHVYGVEWTPDDHVGSGRIRVGHADAGPPGAVAVRPRVLHRAQPRRGRELAGQRDGRSVLAGVHARGVGARDLTLLIKKEPSAVLLAVQLAGVLLYPFMEGRAAGRALFSAFGILVLGLVVLAVRSSAVLNTTVGFVLAVPATILLLIQAVTNDDALLPYSSAFEAVLYFYAGAALIMYMLADHDITRDELFAVGATFTLVAWAFAYTFVVIQAIYPESFTAAVAPAADRTWMELLFLSFTTLSSTGLSDVIPIRPFARGVVMLEQLAGLGYVAIVVSRLVGLTIRRPTRD